MAANINNFDENKNKNKNKNKNTITMSFKVKDKKLFKNYNKTWKKNLKVEILTANLLIVIMINT